MFNVGDKVLARVHYRDEYAPATIVDPSTFNCFTSGRVYAVEFDRNPVGSAGTYNVRRLTVDRSNVKPAA